jgi:hypothetical protein
VSALIDAAITVAGEASGGLDEAIVATDAAAGILVKPPAFSVRRSRPR